MCREACGFKSHLDHHFFGFASTFSRHEVKTPFHYNMEPPSSPAPDLIRLQRILQAAERPTLERLNATCELLAKTYEVERVEILRLDERCASVRVVGAWSSGDVDAPVALSLREEADLEAFADGPAGMRALDLAPIVRKGRLAGFMRVLDRDPNYRWMDDQRALLNDAARLIEQALPADRPTDEVVARRERAGAADEPSDEPVPLILVVEDDPSNSSVLRKIIERKGARAEIASSGKVAVERCKETKFDIIMMDLRMPELDGFDATREIVTGDNLNNDTPIIAITADTTEGVERRCMKLGMRHYIAKPIRASVVSDIIGEFTQSALSANAKDED